MLTIQKFGGTSLADAERIRACAARVIGARREGGQDVVVVVSAMGHTTDRLVALAEELNSEPPRRELDALLATGEQASAALMSMALEAARVPAVSLTPEQLGIVTDPVHGNAKIRSIDATRLKRHLADGRVVVVPGFQGLSAAGEITTLGRGGSDTTAVAIAAALGVGAGTGLCEIYTDVDGVYTADPRVVPEAQKLARVSYEEMVELAALGAGVVHPRAVMFGQRFDVPIHVRHSQRPDDGTLIVPETTDMERVSVVGCALTRRLGRITVRALPPDPGVQAKLFAPIAAAHILVDDIIQVEHGERLHVTFTAAAADLEPLLAAVRPAVAAMDGDPDGVSAERGLAKVSAVGVGMRTHTGVAEMMFRVLGAAKIPIANITTSEIKISCLVPEALAETALRVVHDEAFGLGSREMALTSGLAP